MGEPLDDLIVDGIQGADETRLSLQLKSQIRFTQADVEWAETVRRSWDTVSADGFNAALHRVGIAVANFSVKADAHYRTVLNWARDSHAGDDFIKRISLPDFSHATRSAFVDDVKGILTDYLGAEPSAHQLWTLLRSFVILHFDFNADASSGDDAAAVATLQSYLQGPERARARDVWNAFDTMAGRIIPSAGGVDRTSLVERLTQEAVPAGVQSSLREDVAAIDAESRRALREIRWKIGDVRLHRAEPIRKFAEGADDKRFVQFVSEPGAGKSAVLREIAERYGVEGPLFVLKSDRIQPRGWAAHSATLRISANLEAIVNAIAIAGSPVLFVDGIDRITDPAVQVTLNDVLRAICDSPTASLWLVVATVREQNLRHLETWLDRDVIQALGVRTIDIQPLSEAEKSVVAEAVPRLEPLLREGSAMDVLLSRPFFLEAIFRLSPTSGDLPVSEAELLDLWWELGGSHEHAFAAAQRRRDVLMALAHQATATPNAPLSIAGLDADALQELRSADVLRDHEFGHSVQFTHDIYEEWALCQLLIRHEANLAGFLQSVGEPQTLVRAAQLMGTRSLERDRSGSGWLALLAAVQMDALRPVWHRSILTAPLHSTQTTDLLNDLSTHLFALENGLFARLLTALQTIEVVPNPTFLENDGLEINYELRVRMSQHAALPKVGIWVRFFDWLIPQLGSLPLTLVPELTPVLSTWQNAFGGYRVRFCRQIGIAAHAWLKEAEASFHPERFQDRRNPFGEGSRYEKEQELEKGLRTLLLASAGDAPAEVAAYLADKTKNDRHLHMVRSEITSNSVKLAQFLPAALVDFILQAHTEKPRSRGYDSYDLSRSREFGFVDDQTFYPSSPLKPPFLALLRNHSQEGLRLVHGIVNRATDHWRERPAKGWTPIPVDLDLPWGRQRFWGDGGLYAWFRGVHGPDIAESALMALEQWSFDEIARGVSVDTQIETILKDSHSVALLGVAISLLLSSGRSSVPLSLPFIMEPRLWEWDIGRVVGDQTGNGNEIGNWLSDRVFLEAVRKLNRMPHRQFDIRSLIALYCLSDEETQARYTEEWGRFESKLPFEVEEEKTDNEHVAAVAEKHKMFAQQADLRNFELVRSADGTGFEIHMKPPYAEEEKHQATLARQSETNTTMGLAMWAEKTRENAAIEGRLTLADALALARDIDHEHLFDVDDDGPYAEDRFELAGVTGTACAIAVHWPDEAWSNELGQWCLDVFQRAASRPEPKNLGGRSSVAIMSPQVFAAHGYGALIARQFEVSRSKIALLNLAVDPMEPVQTAVYASSSQYAQSDPEFAFLLLNLALRRCLRTSGDHPDHHSVAWSEAEANRELAELDWAERAMESPEVLSLPAIPMPWVPDASKSNARGFARSSESFDYRLAEKTILNLPLAAILSSPEHKRATVQLASDLIAYTGQRIVPPFAKSKRDERGNTPFEWIFSFSAWCGHLLAALKDEATCTALVDQVKALPGEAPFYLLEQAMRTFMLDAILKPEVIAEQDRAVWEAMTSWILDRPEAQRTESRHHMDRQFLGCAFLTMFCAAIEFRGVVCGADRGWANIKSFETTIAAAATRFGIQQTLFLGVAKLLQAGGIAFFPQPALGWLRSIALARRSNQEFWDSNGDVAVEVLRAAIEHDPSTVQTDGSTIMFIADVLVDNGVRGAGFLQQELSKLSN